MIHVLVETNWVVDACAPTFRRTPEALALLDDARQGRITLHVPGICFREARTVIRRKHQPRESRTLQAFRRWAATTGRLDEHSARVANEFLSCFSDVVSAELDALDGRIEEVLTAEGIEPFGLSEPMLDRALGLRREVPDDLKPFDEAILGAVLVRATELGARERRVFCTLDRDLSPVDRRGNPKAHMQAIYEAVGLEVRTSFDLS